MWRGLSCFAFLQLAGALLLPWGAGGRLVFLLSWRGLACLLGGALCVASSVQLCQRAGGRRVASWPWRGLACLRGGAWLSASSVCSVSACFFAAWCADCWAAVMRHTIGCRKLVFPAALGAYTRFYAALCGNQQLPKPDTKRRTCARSSTCSCSLLEQGFALGWSFWQSRRHSSTT